jgi:hypothetical protein
MELSSTSFEDDSTLMIDSGEEFTMASQLEDRDMKKETRSSLA